MEENYVKTGVKGSSTDERVRKVSRLRTLLNRPELGALGGTILVFSFFAKNLQKIHFPKHLTLLNMLKCLLFGKLILFGVFFAKNEKQECSAIALFETRAMQKTDKLFM